MSELREFLECDLSNLEEGSSCLARHEDGIWYPAKITGIPLRVYLQSLCLLKCHSAEGVENYQASLYSIHFL